MRIIKFEGDRHFMRIIRGGRIFDIIHALKVTTTEITKNTTPVQNIQKSIFAVS
jgi:hypothetical protein